MGIIISDSDIIITDTDITITNGDTHITASDSHIITGDVHIFSHRGVTQAWAKSKPFGDGESACTRGTSSVSTSRIDKNV